MGAAGPEFVKVVRVCKYLYVFTVFFQKAQLRLCRIYHPFSEV